MRPSKRDALIDGALKLFETEGFHASGVDAVAAACGMSKTSIYNHFASKEALIEATLARRDEAFLAALRARLAAGAGDPRARLLDVFDMVADWIAGPAFTGCAFIKAGAEFQAADHPIHALAARHKRALIDEIAALARDAGLRKPKALARRLMLLIDGAVVGAHLGHQKDAARDARAAAETLIAAAVR